MEIRRLAIQGFKSFDKNQVIDFRELESGFYFMSGVNQVEPTLEANGVGKSTIWDALCWCFYGKTSTNLKASAVGNWISKRKCVVEVEFEHIGSVYTLKRAWNPNGLELSEEGKSPKKMSQEDIDDLIDFEFSSFLYAVVVSQFASKFLDLDPSDMLKVFSDIFQLDEWVQYSDQAKVARATLEIDIQKWEVTIAKYHGRLQELEVVDYEAQIADWESNKSVNVKRIITALSKQDQEIKQLKKGLFEGKSELDKLLKIEGFAKTSVDAIAVEIAALDKRGREYIQAIARVEAQIHQAEADINKFDSVVGQCPFCLQEVSDAHITDKKEEYVTVIHAQENEKTILSKEQGMLTKEQVSLCKKLESRRVDYMDIVASRGTLSTDIRHNEQDMERMVEEQEANVNVLESWETVENPYKKLREENTQKLKAGRELLNEAESECKRVGEKRAIYDFWVKGFKDVRLFVISEALNEFEVHINNNLQRLGLPDWEISLAIDSETKSNTVKKGFTVFVKSPHNKDLVPFKCWSGGESQRLRLAGTLGLIDLIESRKGLRWNIEVFDEPTQFLSESGVDDLLEILRQRAKDTGKKLFIVDHRDFHTFGGFTGILKIVKGAGGSEVVYE